MASTTTNGTIPNAAAATTSSNIPKDVLLRRMDKDTFLTGVEMMRYLNALGRAKNVTKVAIPMLLGGTWTTERLNTLQTVLDNGKNRFRRVRVTLQDFRPGCNIREELWTVWKEFIATSTALQELEVSNLTDQEHLELVELVQFVPQLKELRLNGHVVELDTLTKMLHRLSMFQVKTFLNFALLINGKEKELHTAAVDGLARAVSKNYITEGLNIVCADVTSASCEDLTTVYPKQAQMINTITALNKAGRKYLVEDSHNVEQGTKLLSQDHVNSDLNSIFYHLQENTFLCQQGLDENKAPEVAPVKC